MPKAVFMGGFSVIMELELASAKHNSPLRGWPPSSSQREGAILSALRVWMSVFAVGTTKLKCGRSANVAGQRNPENNHDSRAERWFSDSEVHL